MGAVGLPEGVDPWSEDEVFPAADWKAEVANDDTRLGYWEWVAHKREAEAS